MNKDQIYVINQPKHIYSTIIVVDGYIPVDKDAHQKIAELCELSDVLFVFKRDAHKEIDLDKFSSLYESCAYIESEGNISESVIKLMSYDSNIFERHTSTIIINSLEELSHIDTAKLFKVVMSPINDPIFEIRRLNTDEFFEIYKKEDSIFSSFREDDKLKYCSYTTDSGAIILRTKTINIILDSDIKKYIETFAPQPDIRFFFGSLIHHLGINNLNRDYKEVEI